MSANQLVGKSDGQGIDLAGEGIVGTSQPVVVPIQTTAHPLAQLSALVNPGVTLSNRLDQDLQSKTLSELLPRETVNILSETPQAKYRIRVFAKEIEGKQRTLVVVGESHVKSNEAFQQGERITGAFSCRALEGWNSDKYWAGKALNFVTDLFHRIHKSLGVKDEQSGSTIDVAQGEAEIEKYKVKIIALTVQAIQKFHLSSDNREGWKDIDVLKLQGQKFSMADIAEMNIESGGASLHGSKIIKSAFELANNPNTERSATKLSLKVFPLENDHKPTLMEQLGIAYFPTVIAATATTFICMFIPDGPIVTPVKWISGALTSVASLGVICAKLLESRYYDRKWLPYVKGGPLGAIVNGRDRTFVRSINGVFNDHGDVDQLLAIVGRGHVPGMSNLLMREHGWKEIDVPGQKEGY